MCRRRSAANPPSPQVRFCLAGWGRLWLGRLGRLPSWAARGCGLCSWLVLRSGGSSMGYGRGRTQCVKAAEKRFLPSILALVLPLCCSDVKGQC